MEHFQWEWKQPLYFTFWGLQRLQKDGLEKGPLSKMHFLGLGKWMIKRRMKKANVASLERLLNDFRELGGKGNRMRNDHGDHGNEQGKHEPKFN